MSTDNHIVMKGIKNTDVIMCVQKGATKTIPTEDDFIKSNKASFGSEIGQITNYITSMFGVQAKFEKGTQEWNVLDYRIKCGQLLQQNSIDKAKGVVSKPMPKQWYSYKSNRVVEEDDADVKKLKEFNISIMADKKPYFMNYVYPSLMKEYKNYVSETNEQFLNNFGCTVEELREKEYKTEQEEQSLLYFDRIHPNLMTNCTMNKIAWKFENEFDGIMSKIGKSKDAFDYTILKSDYGYSLTTFNRVKELYAEYQKAQKKYYTELNKVPISTYEARQRRLMFVEDFKNKAMEVCSCSSELCDIVLDLCYKNKNSKQFAWDICDSQIVDNLLVKHNYIINYVTKCLDGDILFGEEKYILKTKDLNEGE